MKRVWDLLLCGGFTKLWRNGREGSGIVITEIT